jgi:predicted DNA-binding transcriptional regulator AlpA
MTKELSVERALLSRKDLAALGITKSNVTLLRWEALGRFPRRLRLAGTSVCWLATEVNTWLNDRAAERSRTFYADID